MCVDLHVHLAFVDGDTVYLCLVDKEFLYGNSLWYDAPAPDDLRGWEERSLPVGNGWFGVSVFGGVHAERLQVTEPTFLTRRNLTDALDIRLQFTYPPGVDGYRRGLDLETGLTWMEQTDGKCKFRREAFASYPARVFAYRISCSEKGKLNFSVSPEVPFQRQFGRGCEAYVGRTGHVTANGNVIDVVQHLQWYNVRFFGRILVETDGQVESLDHTLVVKDATEATLYFSCATNYRLRPESFGASAAEFSPETGEPKMRDEDEPSEAVKARVAAAAKKSNVSLDVEKAEEYLKVLSPEKTARLFVAEENFRRMQIGKLRGDGDRDSRSGVPPRR